MGSPTWALRTDAATRRGLAYTGRVKLLAFDTSTEQLCLALCLHGTVWAHEEPGGAQASSRLLPAAQGLLQAHGLNWADLDGLGFGQGPGAFTGLRGTCAAVQGLALGLNRHAVAIPSLRIMAEAARQQAVALGLVLPEQACRVWVAMDARMGQLFDACEVWTGHSWHAESEPAVRDPAAVAQDWTLRADALLLGVDPKGLKGVGPDQAPPGMPWLVAGSGVPLLPPDRVQGLRLTARAWWPEPGDRAAALGHCLALAWRDGEHLDAARVMPLYVRDQVAQTTAEREAARRAADR